MVITFNLRNLVVYLRRLKFHLAFFVGRSINCGVFFYSS